jgi:hypothetical protein
MIQNLLTIRPPNHPYSEVRLELYEYLIKILLHYKSFRSSKSENTFFFFTLLPEEVPAHTRLNTNIHQFVILREKNFFSENLRKQRIKRHRMRLRYDLIYKFGLTFIVDSNLHGHWMKVFYLMMMRNHM